MPGFKPKTNKKLKFNKKNSVTLDGKHKEFLNEFAKNENNKIPELKNEKKELQKKITDLNENLTIEQKLDINDKIIDITNIKIMTGGLLQLSAYGAQNIYLSGNPQITFFVGVYKRHTNFAIQNTPQYFNGNSDFGQKVYCDIDRIGDLINQIFLREIKY